MSQFTTTTIETWRTWEEEYTYGPDEGQMDTIAFNIGASEGLQWGKLGEPYRKIDTQTIPAFGAMAGWDIYRVEADWGPNISPIPNSEYPIPNDPVVTYEQKPHTYQTSPGPSIYSRLPYPDCTVNLIPQPDVRTFNKTKPGVLTGGSCEYRYSAKLWRTFKVWDQPLIGHIECDGTTCTFTYPLESLFGEARLDGKKTWKQNEMLFVDLGVHSINTIKYTNEYFVDHTRKGTCFWERCHCSDFGLWNTQQACANATCGGVIYAHHPRSSTPEEGAWSRNPAGVPCMFTTPGPQGCCWTY